MISMCRAGLLFLGEREAFSCKLVSFSVCDCVLWLVTSEELIGCLGSGVFVVLGFAVFFLLGGSLYLNFLAIMC